MRFVITIFIILLFFLQAQSQSKCDCYERLSNLAELKFNEGKLDSALIIYKKAFSFLSDDSKDKFHYFLMAQYFIVNNIVDSSAYYLGKALQKGYDSSYILQNKNFASLINSDYWNDVKNLKPLFENFNWDFYNSIKEMVGVDQAIRDEDKLGKWANDSVYYLVDSINFNTLKELINEYGLPTVLTHGFHINEIMIFLMHASMHSDEMFKDVLDILYEANAKCLISKSFIAMFIDRRLIWHKNEKQILGTWNYANEFNPIRDLNKIDSLRFNYNLLNLHDYGKLRNLEVPDGYTKSDYPSGYFCE